MRIQIGFSRKVGEANYGSRGASLSIEQDVDPAAAASPKSLYKLTRSLQRLVQRRVEEALAERGSSPHNVSSRRALGQKTRQLASHQAARPAAQQAQTDSLPGRLPDILPGRLAESRAGTSGNLRSRGDSGIASAGGASSTSSPLATRRGHAQAQTRQPRRSRLTLRQVRAMRSICRRQPVSLRETLETEFPGRRLRSLSIQEASHLIDSLWRRAKFATNGGQQAADLAD